MSDPRGEGPSRLEPPERDESAPEPLCDPSERVTDVGPDGAFDADAARVRLEDLLLSLPYDRMLPDLADLLDRAGVPDELLRRDDRLLKVLHEAVLARPLGRPGEAEGVRIEVELLTLEVEVLTDRLASRSTSREAVHAADLRLAEVTARLQEIRGVI